MDKKIARLRVEIDEVEPLVVRRLEVPLDIRLDDLHFVLQIAIGWQNCHPFEFRVDAAAEQKRWGLVDKDDPASSPLPAERATLGDLLALGQEEFHYDYVYGEDWSHSVEVEAILPASGDAASPRLLSARGRCPPADIGGAMGYETYLRAIADPLHLNHEGMREWEVAEFDPHVVDEAAIRANLANLGKYLGRRKPAG
jgi:hypothetical protein